MCMSIHHDLQPVGFPTKCHNVLEVRSQKPRTSYYYDLCEVHHLEPGTPQHHDVLDVEYHTREQ